ncbi:hypothetical protein H6G76_13455 [Nostoc sp. FACHB-152]|uniref:hypothetical protein n=1 Tax=unclassified Nostoc TaxID=2593658 RepID=UPI0016823D92|nr:MULTISPECIES: hypothetical protein [unclassified Nostoc]MBD2448154.1 hypothetical protein [Nostoc sp. FACHB-152]MBD2470569.1 hypothetical protein [Nostoc sp. FACHB-145]
MMPSLGLSLAASSVTLFGWLSDHFKTHYMAIASYTVILMVCVLMAIESQTIICYA